MTAQLRPMPEPALAEWRAARANAGTPLAEPSGDDGFEALHVVVDEVVAGGAIATYDVQGGRARGLVRTLQTTIPPDATEVWAAVLAAFEEHVRTRGVVTLVTSVPPDHARAFQAAGFRTTMTSVGKRLDPSSAPELQEDRRVAVRPMDAAERRQFVGDVARILRTGMEQAGVLVGSGASTAALDARVARLACAPPPEGELLVMGLVDGEPVGRAWATLVTADDGSLDFLGNTLDLFPQFRGQRLTPSFLGALVRHVREIGVRDVHLRVYGHHHGARRTFLDQGASVREVHLRKDLDAASGR